MVDKYELCSFLVEAKKSTYAAGDNAQKTLEKDGSTTLLFEEGNRKYHDNYFGGEPFGGREIVFYDNQPVYIMTYYGYVYDIVPNLKDVYRFLQSALSLISVDAPYRGPGRYDDGNLSYINTFTGDITRFSGEEYITQDGKEVYKTLYMGGLVDQRQ